MGSNKRIQTCMVLHVRTNSSPTQRSSGYSLRIPLGQAASLAASPALKPGGIPGFPTWRHPRSWYINQNGVSALGLVLMDNMSALGK